MATTIEPPVIASRKPFYCELRAGRTIAWCQCGRSKRQPYCDGRSHTGTGYEPLLYTVGPEPEEVLLCGCKHTRTPPFCDGTHSNLPGGYAGDDRSDEERARCRRVTDDAAGWRQLDDRCYVVAPAATRPAAGGFWIRPIIAPSLGAHHQSQFYVEAPAGPSPVLGAGADAAVLLFISSGSGTVEIGGRSFAAGPGDGIHVRAGERFRLHVDAPLTAFASALPAVEALTIHDAMDDRFDADHPQRVVGINRDERTAMGPRWFQMLVDKAVGSTDAAQFIGHIPPSRAEMHKHLYEEALIIWSGEGIMWNEGSCTPVRAGDVIFLPRKHAHSLESTGADGMDVVGVIHPGDNPGINY